jgi:flavin-dependent dehydrogenase
MAGARRIAPVRALGPLAYRVSAPRQGGVLLVGDAAGFYDPFTGEGVFTALRGAELAAETAVAALRRQDVTAAGLAGYEQRRREAFAAKAGVTRALQAVVGRRWLANTAARVLARRPALLEALMAVIGDYAPPTALLRAVAGR